MDEPRPLNSLFEKKPFRIPDYQRGYAWQPEQLKDFWEDLMNLPKNRNHYTGVLTLKQASSDIEKEDEEYFLVKDRSFNLYHVVDGQQRLTTFVIFLQAFIEFFRILPENRGKPDSEIFISGSLSIAYAQSDFCSRLILWAFKIERTSLATQQITPATGIYVTGSLMRRGAVPYRRPSIR